MDILEVSSESEVFRGEVVQQVGVSYVSSYLLNLCITGLNCVLGHCSAVYTILVLQNTSVNEMNIVMNHAPCAGSIVRPVDHAVVHLATTVPLTPPFIEEKKHLYISAIWLLETI